MHSGGDGGREYNVKATRCTPSGVRGVRLLVRLIYLSKWLTGRPELTASPIDQPVANVFSGSPVVPKLGF